MKKLIFAIAVTGSSFICSIGFSQSQIKDSLGLPGDNLNLYGVLDLFQQSKTLEEFETKLNAQDSKINNLDLNGDNKIDYIKVVDNMQGTSHAIVLKDEISEKEMQDVAVIEVDKYKDGKVTIQIVGDEELYGKNYIVEPKDETAKDKSSGGTPNPGYTGGNQTTVINNTTNNYYDNDNYYPDNNYGGHAYYPLNTWYMWDFLYGPTYVVYVSPWHWGYYPHYWNPWVPWYWHEYYGFHYHHYGYYHRAYSYRATVAHGFYASHRNVSVTVTQHRNSGTYRNTYQRRDLLNKSMTENKSVRDNGMKQQNRDEHRNTDSKQNDVRQRNDNKTNDNRQRNDNRVNDNQQKNNQQPGNQQRNDTRENKRERNNNQQTKPSQTERKTERAQQKSQSQPRNQPRQNNPGGGGKRK